MNRRKTVMMAILLFAFAGFLETTVIASPSPSRVIIISSTEVAFTMWVDSNGVTHATGTCVEPNWCAPPPSEIAQPKQSTAIWADSDGTVHMNGPCIEPEWCSSVVVFQPFALWYLMFYPFWVVGNP